MKELQLWLASALLCCGLMGQSPDQSNTPSVLEVNSVFRFFTVTPQNGQAVLRWAAPTSKPEDFFIVEKSSDALHFEMLSAMDASSVGMDSIYSLTDNSVGGGIVSYRIRITGKDGKERCSHTVNMSSIPVADFRFYPNPVDKLLIIRSSHPLNIQIVDIYGTTWFKQDVEGGMQIVNVSSLQKGNYILNATDKTTNTVISEQLVKNN